METKERKVMIAMDGSVHAEFAFDWYLNSFRSPQDLVLLMHCIERHDKFHAGKEKLTGTVKTGVGNPGEMVISTAKKEHADVIICGCRGLGKLRRTFTGTVSDYIVHHSHVPVVVCRHPSHKDEIQHQK